MNVFKGLAISAFTAVTLFACQEVDSPVSPDFDFSFVAHHSNGHGGGGGNGGGNGGGEPDPVFSVDIAGEVSGSADATESIKDQIVANPFTLDITAIRDALGSVCFPNAAYTSVLALTRSSQDPDVVDVQMVFRAKGTDGTTDVKYALSMSGALQGDTWLPSGTSTIDLGAGSPDWTIGHDSGKGKNLACFGDGELEATVTVTAQ